VPLLILCAGCQRWLRLPETVPGQQVRCPLCRKVVAVHPAAGPAAPSAGRLPDWIDSLDVPDPAALPPAVPDWLDEVRQAGPPPLPPDRA
jgi:hypothetical protein